MLPMAREEDLIIQESSAGLIVYDQRMNKTLNLNEMSALVWKKCDGERSPWQIGKEVEKALGIKMHEELVWSTLNELYQAKLLNEIKDFKERYENSSYQEFTKKMFIEYQNSFFSDFL